MSSPSYLGAGNGFTSYLDVPGFLSLPNGGDFDDVLLASALLGQAQVAGDSVLLPAGGTTGFVAGVAYVFDAAASEVVKVASVDSTTLHLASPLLSAHAIGVNVAQGPLAGGVESAGSLPRSIMAASGWIENYTQRRLALNTHTIENERALVDKDGFLLLTVREWPVISWTALTLVIPPSTLLTLDQTQVQPDKGKRGRLWVYTGPAGSYCPGIPAIRGRTAWVQASYMAGYSPIPIDLQEACQLRTMTLINQRDNYLGASAVQVDHTRIEQRLRGDDGFDDLFIARAKELINGYVRRT